MGRMPPVAAGAAALALLLFALSASSSALAEVAGAPPRRPIRRPSASSRSRAAAFAPGAGRLDGEQVAGATAALSVRGGASSSDEEYDEEYDPYDDDDEEEKEEATDSDEEDEEDEEDDDDDDDDDDERSASHLESTGAEDWDLVDHVLSATKKLLVLAGRITVSAVLALQRAIEAAGETEEGEGAAGKLGRMLDAAFNPPAEEEEEELEKSVRGKGGGDLEDSIKRKSGEDLAKSVRRKSKSGAVKAEEMAQYLSKAYGATWTEEESAPVMGGSLSDALTSARSRARLLVALIPATKPSKRNQYDSLAVASLLSAEVKAVCDRRARKKEEEYGSFALWSAVSGSAEANAAVKGLKAKKVSKGSPYLMVCYGAQAIDSSGRPRLAPRLLAQHHCNPPPSPSSMSSWLNALRKRHAREYASMHRSLRELRYHRERTEGYRSSARDDREREARERREREERERREQEERARLEFLERRRARLRESLPEEPPPGETEGVATVALRFGDGRTGRRRFRADETTVDALFDWADAMFGVERERVELSTMNGQKRFRYSGEDGGMGSPTLTEAGLGKMTGLRVAKLAKEEEEEGKEDAEEDVIDDDVEEE